MRSFRVIRLPRSFLDSDLLKSAHEVPLAICCFVRISRRMSKGGLHRKTLEKWKIGIAITPNSTRKKKYQANYRDQAFKLPFYFCCYAAKQPSEYM